MDPNTGRITEHPILSFRRGRKVVFTFDGRPVEAYEGETIVAALHAAGIRILRRTHKGNPRGLFCAIGKCSSCLATVDGIPNVRTCITPVWEGMAVESQRGPGRLDPGFRPRDREVRKLQAEVAVVGAGPAGLSAARTLLLVETENLIVATGAEERFSLFPSRGTTSRGFTAPGRCRP